VILVTSSIGVFGPILLKRFTAISMHSLVFTVLKQFGTGVIISTAYVHLLTHAQLLWANECLGQLAYEGTATAIAMAGIFLAFLVEFVGHRIVASRASRRVAHGHHHPDNETASPRCDPLVSSSPSPSPSPQEPDEKSPSTGPSRGFAALGHSHGPVTGSGRGDDSFSVSVMEAGIIFHSVIIGVTLVVAGDSFFTTLFIVILFHQFFEGLALGTRIAALPSPSAGRKGVSTLARLVMGGVFAIITPVGMAIGIGCLGSFNGNDKATIVATGTLDALSAGILVWVGVVGMWASDWVFEGGDMVHAKWPRVCVGLGSLVAGMVVMSVLGKWA
jgi:zinc transporter 1/2/3